MTFELKGLAEALGVLPRYFLGIALASSILLFGPPSMLVSLGMSDFVEQYRTWIGFAFLLSTVMSVVPLGGKLVAAITGWVQASTDAKYRAKVLRSLTLQERMVLAGYVVRNTNSVRAPLSDGVVQGLVHRQVLYRSTNLSDEWQNFAFNLHPWAQQLLERQPEILEPEVTILREQLTSKGRLTN